MVKRVKLGYRWVDFDELAPEEKKQSLIQHLKEKQQKLRKEKRSFENAKDEQSIEIYNQISEDLNGINKALSDLGVKSSPKSRPSNRFSKDDLSTLRNPPTIPDISFKRKPKRFQSKKTKNSTKDITW
ncbi:TPA: hypothetical protein N2736_000217 [Vibrio parahaemolyticus]|nr:hypothetical protein [Vibrio parahaemolyticus]HCM0619243.1 hypothetical protein [Vibrio parahaemolyticus]